MGLWRSWRGHTGVFSTTRYLLTLFDVQSSMERAQAARKLFAERRSGVRQGSHDKNTCIYKVVYLHPFLLVTSLQGSPEQSSSRESGQERTDDVEGVSSAEVGEERTRADAEETYE